MNKTVITLKDLAKEYGDKLIYAMTPTGYAAITPDMVPQLDALETIRVSLGDSELLTRPASEILGYVVTNACISPKDIGRINAFCDYPDAEGESNDIAT